MSPSLTLRWKLVQITKNTVFAMLRRQSLVRTDVSEERSAYIIRVTRSCELGNSLAKLATDARSEEILLTFFLYRRFLTP
jgi:hypothetical protein